MPYVGGDVLGAFDQSAWDAYQASGKTGAWQGPPNGTLEDPNGGIIYFDANGQQDRYDPPAAYHPTTFGGTVSTDSVVEKDPGSTFYGWTELERAAFAAATLPAGPWTTLVTDYLRGKTAPYSDADKAESDRRLRAFAASSAKVQTALKSQGLGGAYLVERADEIAAEELATKRKNAQNIIDRWQAYRESPAGRLANPPLPQEPFTWWYPPVDAETLAFIKELAKGLPAPPPPPPANVPVTPLPPPMPAPTAGMTNGSSSAGQTGAVPSGQAQVSSAAANYPATTAPAPTMPSEGGALVSRMPVLMDAPAPASSSRKWLYIGGATAIVAGIAIAATRPKRRR